MTVGFTGRVFSGSYRFALARYTANGALDHSFGTKGHVTTKVGSRGAVANSVAVQPDGRIVAAGLVGTGDRFVVARYLPSGKLDAGFGTGGLVQTVLGTNAVPWAVTLQPDGKIIVVGTVGEDAVVARYTADGSLDPTFGTNGTVSPSFGAPSDGLAVAVQDDGKIVLAGTVGTGNPADPGYKFARSPAATRSGRSIRRSAPAAWLRHRSGTSSPPTSRTWCCLRRCDPARRQDRRRRGESSPVAPAAAISPSRVTCRTGVSIPASATAAR